MESVQTVLEMDGEFLSSPGGAPVADLFLHIALDRQDEDLRARLCEQALKQSVQSAGDRQRMPIQARFGPKHWAVLKTIEKMEASLADPENLDAIARTIGLSRRHIERLFREETGRSPARFFLELRLERAHLLIVNSRMTVFDIAIACGFTSASHFSRAYQRRYGCLPRQARAGGWRSGRSIDP